ncbi:MAG: succinate dehydrogenase, cytochrome b556 subunit [Candidatus Muproteobacteria bacterium RBG_16_62_13]|uniref:Succinate dehydrogenase cytochrome b556 subunit n=1 Tax=Candidatus Muproteobacteria bacterium RBG_16_62_13 TaxID=1817756 RepID=A0A1F6SXL4_9PROT|nr:MAG: succinate dehydrogenase, cytochrome b556 subunit [Candidatus Muproteobacteria bacterium RBG_16_62_13]
MDKNKKRPVHLDLFVIRLPVTGVVSILHRLTGVLLVLAFPLFLYLLQQSLRDPTGFAEVRELLRGPMGRVLSILVIWLFAQHFYSGVRHLLLDFDIGIERSRARIGSWLVLVASAVTVLVVWSLA